jgi:hypothetical protein
MTRQPRRNLCRRVEFLLPEQLEGCPGATKTYAGKGYLRYALSSVSRMAQERLVLPPGHRRICRYVAMSCLIAKAACQVLSQ